MSQARPHLWCVSAVLGLWVGLACPAARAAGSLVFLDNDFSGPGETNIEALYPVLGDADARLLGVGAVTGDAWRDEGIAHLAAFLDRIGCAGVPVYKGAERPLRRTPAEMADWERRFGRILWKGAWQAPSPRHPGQHPDQPGLVPPLVEGPGTSGTQAPSAAEAMIAAVHKYPHQVTIVAAGPMTDLALAIERDPAFAGLARGLVFMGGLIDTDRDQIAVEQQHTIDFYTDFNMIFDPEAAHVVLTAPWAAIVNAGDVTLGVRLPQSLVAAAAAAHTPQGDYFARYAQAGIPMWDELTMAIALHPELVTGAVTATMDVDTGGGLAYGRAHARPAGLAPTGSPPVRIVTAVDQDRFLRIFAASFQGAPHCSR